MARYVQVLFLDDELALEVDLLPQSLWELPSTKPDDFPICLHFLYEPTTKPLTLHGDKKDQQKTKKQKKAMMDAFDWTTNALDHFCGSSINASTTPIFGTIVTLCVYNDRYFEKTPVCSCHCKNALPDDE